MSGALVISLDYERHWGVLERPVDGSYRDNLLGVPASVRGTLGLFREFGISATWAIVGFLLARDRAERERFSPALRPLLEGREPDPYEVPTGESEEDDPFHYGYSVVPEILATPGQEVATHTFAHVYCLSPALSPEAVGADLASARAITQATTGRLVRSVVFPRNQHNPALEPVLLEQGIRVYRGHQPSWMWRPDREHLMARAARLVDAYIPIGQMNTVQWAEIPQPNGLANVRASFFLRPLSDGLRLQRILGAIRHAAVHDEVVHLWWHPHNFGVRTAENLAVLRAILETFAWCRAELGMRSLTMEAAAIHANAVVGSPAAVSA